MRIFVLLAVMVALVAACSAEQQQTEPTPAPSPLEPVATQPPPGGAGGASVSIVDFNFDPATVTVNAEDVISWTNDGAAPHTVTFEGGPDSGTLESGDTFEHAFAAPGEYTYVCSIHPAMRGVVNVGP